MLFDNGSFSIGKINFVYFTTYEKLEDKLFNEENK